MTRPAIRVHPGFCMLDARDPMRLASHDRTPPLPEDLPAPATAMLTGSSSTLLAVTSLALLERGWRILMPPSLTTEGQLPQAPCTLRIDCERDGLHIGRGPGTPVPGDWTLALGTSGSTGTPRLFGFDRSQIEQVTDWYREIYQIGVDSVIVTALPTAHNFAFVAGLCTAAAAGAAFAPVDDARRLLETAQQLAERHDRVVILANPVTLEAMLQRIVRLPDHVSIDSGGAPLARSAIVAIRADVCDLREGYGTTETLSLTHFDRTDHPAAIGTVGRPLPEVSCRIATPQPAIEVSTPLMGMPLTGTLQGTPPPEWVRTGDLGEWTPEGNLRLLGRTADQRIAGLWPRDVLDAIGPTLGMRTALVTHNEPATIRVRTLLPLTEREESALRGLVAARMQGDHVPEIHCDSSQQRVLYSAKLPRPARV